MIVKPLKVLVVEADPTAAMALQGSLLAAASSLAPVEVVAVHTLADSLAHIAKHHRADLVLISGLLGNDGGLQRLRARLPCATVVVVTEPAHEPLAKEALQAVAQDYLLRSECEPRTLSRVLRYSVERRRAQDELRERREFSRLISQNVTDLIMVLDKEGRRVYHSPSYKTVLGDLEFVKGSTAFLEIHPEDRASVQRVFKQTMATGVSQRIEYRFLLKDGSVRNVESQANVIRDRWGKPFKMVVVSRDITERTRAEQALRESEQRYKRLLASTTDYIFTVKVENGRSVSTTHGPGCEALTGYTPEDFEKSPQLWLGVVAIEDRPMVLDQVNQLLKGEIPPAIEHRLVRKDGKVRWIRNTSVPRRDEHGLLIAYDGLISDITERKTAEEELKHAYEALKAAQFQLIQAEKFESIGTLAAGVAHEVKNPLQTILMGLAYFSKNMPQSDPNMPMVIADTKDAVRRADTIVRELLTLSASTHITMKDEDFNAVLERALVLVNYEINAARVHVVKTLTTPLPHVLIDRTRIEQVFLNLLLNAIQAMPQGGTLTLRTRLETWTDASLRSERGVTLPQPGDSVVVAEVQDTGVGIPPQHLLKVFDPFFTTKPVGSGTGLGLSVAKQIIDLHGGMITINNAPGGGVLVKILLKARDTISHEQEENPGH